MQNKIIDYFLEITKIPHCSKNTDKLLEFIKEFAINRGYIVEIDKAKNILVKKGKPKLALQAHYDMVCIGKAPEIETYIKDGWMYAKNSSLGADNGIAIAMMMVLIDRNYELEFLFTSDEEIGLIGASNLELILDSKYMLNIDFEDEAEVCIGCAGGIDLLAFGELEVANRLDFIYEVSVSGLVGGHSGIDIDKDIPNAIKVLGNFLANRDIVLNSFYGGERRNSIPTSAKAIISSTEQLKSDGVINIKSIKSNFDFYNGDKFIKLINSFPHGVDRYNKKLNIPDTSINLAIVKMENAKVFIETSARALSLDGLSDICNKNIKLFKEYGFEVEEKDKYPAWKPEINDFSKIVNTSMLNIFGKSEYKAIHAGLECGVISKKYPNIKIASIGPNIRYPHSTREKIEIESIIKTFKVLETVINKIK